MPSAATAASPPHHRTFPGIRTRGMGTEGIDGISIPPRAPRSCGRSAVAPARRAGWRGRWPRGRGTWLFAVAPRAPAPVVELDDIGSPPDMPGPSRRTRTDARPVIAIAVPRLGRGTRQGGQYKTRGTFAFLATRRWRGVRIWLATRNPASCWSLSSLSSHRAGYAPDRAECPGTAGHRSRRCRGPRAKRRYVTECGNAGRSES
jgi:hypothetical protein